MIIQLESARVDDLLAAWRDLVNLGYRWGEDIAGAPISAVTNILHAEAMRMLIPPAALTVLDPADRAGKRQRAEELIQEAQYLAAGQVAAWVVTPSRVVELSTLTPDQVLVLAREDPAS